MLNNDSLQENSSSADHTHSNASKEQRSKKNGYQGNITSKEAGNIVRDMIREQEKVMMERYK